MKKCVIISILPSVFTFLQQQHQRGAEKKNAKFEVIKLSEKKEMLAATITDNDRIGPSLAVLCSIEQDGASLKIFMTAGIHILICSCVSGSNG